MSEQKDFASWVKSLSLAERGELAKEIGYSTGYIVKMAYTQHQASAFVILEILNSKFNTSRAPSARLTKAAANDLIEELTAARRKKRPVRNS